MTTAPVTPHRIQRKRTKGWRMPEGVVYVGRPTKWGNPFRVGEPYRLTTRPDVGRVVGSRQEAVNLFRDIARTPEELAEIRAELRGRDLACWCPLDQPCHADVLLELANG